VEGFVHADLAGEADPGMFAREAGGLEEMDAEVAIAIFAGPELAMFEGAEVLREDGGRGGFGRVDDDDDFDGAGGAFAAPKGI